MKVASDTHRFDVVWKGSWYWLGSLSDHHRHKVDPTGPLYLLIDRRWQTHLVPKNEVHIPCNPI